MAYVAPTSRSDGYVVDATEWNKNTVDNPIALKALIDALPSTVDNSPCEGRLTLTTGVPVTTADVTAAGTLYWAPYKGNRIALYSGSAWVTFAQAQLSIAVPAAANQVYDVFVDYNSGTPALSLTAWTNDTTRATALTTQDGVLVLSGSTGKRYVGTVRTVTASQLNDSVLLRHVWNYYHRLPRTLTRAESTVSWAYTTATIRQANNSTANQVSVVVGVAEVPIDVSVQVAVTNTNASITRTVGIGEDTTSAFTIAQFAQGGAGEYDQLGVRLVKFPAIGYHYYSWNEYSVATGTTTWQANSALPTGTASGLTGWIEG